jgi:hypothetical protein
MRSETRLKSISFIKFALAVVLCTGGAVLADWEVGDPALYYQTPDPVGWSVYSEWGTGTVENEGYGAGADDWTAAVTAPVTDIFFWGGWKNDVVGQTNEIIVQIFSSDTSDPAFPRPDELLWGRVINTSEYTRRSWSNSPADNQGWYDPRYTDHWEANNHGSMYQYSIPVIASPFVQQAGQTYWLTISVDVEGGVWGWNSAENVSGGSAVFWDKNSPSGWTELMTPVGYNEPRIPLDLAFVLNTPEPAALLLFGPGAAIVRKRRR